MTGGELAIIIVFVLTAIFAFFSLYLTLVAGSSPKYDLDNFWQSYDVKTEEYNFDASHQPQAKKAAI